MSIKLCVGEKARTKYREILTVVMIALEMVGGGGSFFQGFIVAVSHFWSGKIYEIKS